LEVIFSGRSAGIVFWESPNPILDPKAHLSAQNLKFPNTDTKTTENTRCPEDLKTLLVQGGEKL